MYYYVLINDILFHHFHLHRVEINFQHLLIIQIGTTHSAKIYKVCSFFFNYH